MTDAERFSQEFHGREPLQEFVAEAVTDKKELTVLGQLLELLVATGEGDDGLLLEFRDSFVLLAAEPDTKRLVIAGDTHEAATLADELGVIGELVSVTYYTDKHHLGDQGGIAEYVHEFGEKGGELPILMFDYDSQQLIIVGGSYTITEAGIVG